MGKATGIKYVCVHIIKLEKTLRLYREILGFELFNAKILEGELVKEMLVLELRAGNCTINLSLTSPKLFDNVKEIGNTNHNHFMLYVDDIASIGDSLVEEGYELENMEYARDKYTFFTGPNGEIVGLSEKQN